MATSASTSYNPASLPTEEFISHEKILETLRYAEENKRNEELIDRILEKACPEYGGGKVRYEGLTHRKASASLVYDLPEKSAEMMKLAEEIRLAFYGNRIVLFASLYLSNYCVNGCIYCPHHAENKHIKQRELTQEEVWQEVIALRDMGHKRPTLEAGEDPSRNPIDYILKCIRTIYGIHHKDGDIRHVNVNITATTVEDYRRLRGVDIGTYILSQETYHKESYEALHPTDPKHGYRHHIEAMDRAMEGDIDGVDIGVLFGLDEYHYEFVGLLMHAEHLEAVHGVGPHTISVPCLEEANDVDPAKFDNDIDDGTFLKIIACIRITVPCTGMIILTHEPEAVRDKALRVGISQISGDSRTLVGGYAKEERMHGTEQFDVSDQRTLDEVLLQSMRDGFLPSFCTTCYHEGRTGDRFMGLCGSGQIQNCCRPNALMTLAEHLTDYASEEIRGTGKAFVEAELTTIPNEESRAIAVENIKEIYASSRRDFRFWDSALYGCPVLLDGRDMIS